jgi:hypothetical protein
MIFSPSALHVGTKNSWESLAVDRRDWSGCSRIQDGSAVPGATEKHRRQLVPAGNLEPGSYDTERQAGAPMTPPAHSLTESSLTSSTSSTARCGTATGRQWRWVCKQPSSFGTLAVDTPGGRLRRHPGDDDAVTPSAVRRRRAGPVPASPLSRPTGRPELEMQGRKQEFLAKRTRRARSFAALAFCARCKRPTAGRSRPGVSHEGGDSREGPADD